MATIPQALRRPRLSRRTIASLLVVALGIPLVAGAGWVAFSGDSVLGEMELAASGEVIVLRGGETIDVGDGTFELQAGDLISTGATGKAEFNLEGVRSIELAADSSVKVGGTAAFAVEGGSVLAQTGDATKVTVGTLAIAAPDSAAMFRVDRVSTVTTGVYEGNITVSVPGQGSLRVPDLFQVSMPVAAPNVPARPDPYAFDRKDGWDSAHLNDVIALDTELEQTARGLASQFEKKPPLSYYQAVVGSPVKFMKPFLDLRPADLLVGLTVARGTSSNLAGPFTKTMELVFERGAQWGIAAAIMEARPKQLLNGLSALISKSGVTGGKGAAAQQFALASGSVASGSADGPGTTLPGDDGDNGDDENNPIVTPTTQPTSSPSPSPSPTPTDSPEPPEECGTDLECAVKDLDPPVDNPLESDVGKELTGGGGKDPKSSDLLGL